MPEWTKGPARSVDNGYIVYVEASEDANPDKAKFKAEAAALEDLANECSFIPKEARVEDRYSFKKDHTNQAFAKVGIEFQVCDKARKTIEPEEIRKIANVPMTEEVKRYQELLGKPNFEEVADQEIETPPVPAGGPASAQVSEHFYVVRERVWYFKETVILSPPGTYVAGSPEHTAYVQQVSTGTTALAKYETLHPEVRTTPTTWSYYRPAVVQKYAAPVMMKAAPVRANSPARVLSAPRPAPPPPVRRAKRRLRQ